MRTIDSFIFYNEFDLLEGRLEYLYDHVDHFILVESDITFSGKKKPFYFRENMNRYKKYLDKIIYRPFTVKNLEQFDFNKKLLHMDITTAPWKIEHLHRQEILNVAETFDDDDLLIMSDADEIPSIGAINASRAVLKSAPYHVIAFDQDMFLYNFKTKLVDGWPGSVAALNKVARQQGGEWMRMMRYSMPRLTNGGWHLSYWLDPEKIAMKIESFSHQELNTDYMKNPDRILDRVSNGTDIYDRVIPITQNDLTTIDPVIYSIFERYQVGI